MFNVGTTCSTSEVAARLRITPRQVARLVELGKLEPVAKAPGIRGAFIFAEVDVERYERGRTS